MTRLVRPLGGLLVALTVVLSPAAPGLRAAADTLPAQLTDEAFWKLSERLSEPDGFFQSDNLLSNEIFFPEVMDELVQRSKQGAVYLGVGPEQNFNYIAALRPKMVIITDVRRGNLHTHLMYKALFELSADRAEFVGRLFTKKRPEFGANATVAQIINAIWQTPTDTEAVYRTNLQAIANHLTKTRRLPLSADDLSGIERIYHAFYWFGPSITYNSSTGGGGGGSMTDYASLMVAQDSKGQPRSYLSSEESFQFLKGLEQRNLVVPVVGNFAGPTALRSVGQYVRDHGATVAAFYLSNVEQYLNQDGIWNAFCANVASMPLDAQSTFIRSGRGFGIGGGGGGGGGLRNSLGSMIEETRGCGVPAGQPVPTR